jgi:Cysteine-rich secretory protein family
MLFQSNANIDMNSFLTKMITMWYNEHDFMRISDVNLLTTMNGGNGKVIGHFTVMANEKSTAVGCAVGSWQGKSSREFLLVCNYAYTNMMTRRVWGTGSPASACVTGRDSIFTNLCSIREPISPNN